MKEIENNMYYQTGIKTSRNEDSVYAMKYASQQMMIDKLQKENQQLKEQLQQKEDIINKANNYVIDNANIYLNIYGEKIGFFKENDGKTPIELLKILDNKGE